ncbi:hypothetical protein C8F04DRAFT_1173139 [Mycena alexandri]|uniref:Uncharacterized protein n=1 Tax=Mycena alexandri TaxID=1745969 RepID=A0AAD6XID5_9AGAR|nr:hypothetical protein C8F04DRAFT_1173139 [Mycena alexandri]
MQWVALQKRICPEFEFELEFKVLWNQLSPHMGCLFDLTLVGTFRSVYMFRGTEVQILVTAWEGNYVTYKLQESRRALGRPHPVRLGAAFSEGGRFRPLSEGRHTRIPQAREDEGKWGINEIGCTTRQTDRYWAKLRIGRVDGKLWHIPKENR